MSKYRILRMAAAALATLAVFVSLGSKPASAQDNGVVDGWIAAWNSHDPDALVAVFTADIFFEDLAFGVVGHGSDEVRAIAQSFFTAAPDLRVDLVNSSVNGGHGFIEWVFSGTDVALFGTGKTFSVRGATVIDVVGDKISRESDYYDQATILRELGLLPPGP